jgi:hypothetical protein
MWGLSTLSDVAAASRRRDRAFPDQVRPLKMPLGGWKPPAAWLGHTRLSAGATAGFADRAGRKPTGIFPATFSTFAIVTVAERLKSGIRPGGT